MSQNLKLHLHNSEVELSMELCKEIFKYSKLTFIIFIYLYLKKFMFEVPNTILDEVIELTETAIMEKIDSFNYYLSVCDD